MSPKIHPLLCLFLYEALKKHVVLGHNEIILEHGKAQPDSVW